MFIMSVDIHAGKAQIVAGTAVEMKDNEDVDDLCMKDWQVDMRMTEGTGTGSEVLAGTCQ